MERTDLNHDAFKINGLYLEDLIADYTLTTDTAVNSLKSYFSLSGGLYSKVTPVGNENPSTQGWYEKGIHGYMTYKAEGRESLDKQIETYTNGSDGETVKRTRFPIRKIQISYLVEGTSLADLRTKMHKLQTRLNVNKAEIVFNDDPNCYYIATPVMSTSISDAHNAVMGTFDLVCHDPFKYDKTLTEVNTSSHTDTVKDEDGNTSTVTSTVLTTDNSGGYKAFPIFQVQFATDENASGSVGSNADCGYVLFAKGGTNYSVQIGDEQEKDIGTVTEVAQNFTKSSKGSFVDTNTITPFRSKLAFNGSSKANSKGLMINSTTNVSGKFHGPMVVYSFENSHTATGEFTLNWKNVFACAKDTATAKKQTGAVWIMLLDSSNVCKLAYGLEKSSTTSLNAKEYVYDYTNGIWEPDTYPVKYTGPSGYKSNSDTTGRLSKVTMKRRINYDDNNNVTGASTVITTAQNADLEIRESSPCTISKVAVFFGKYGSEAGMYSNRMTFIEFLNGNVDVVNTFGSGDLAVVDCGKAEITLNEKSAADLGDVGNNWEDMYLDVGANTVYVQYSSWINASYLPTITMTYRKRWL